MYLFISKNVISCWAWWKPYRAAYDFQGSFSRSHKTCKEIVNKTNFHTVVSFFQPKCMVYACFVAKMSKMAFTRFGGQFQFEKSMLGRFGLGGQVWPDMHNSNQKSSNCNKEVAPKTCHFKQTICGLQKNSILTADVWFCSGCDIGQWSEVALPVKKSLCMLKSSQNSFLGVERLRFNDLSFVNSTSFK